MRHRVAVRIINGTDKDFRVTPGVRLQPDVPILGPRGVRCPAQAETTFTYDIPAAAFSTQRPLIIVTCESGESFGVLGDELGDRVLWYGALAALGVTVVATYALAHSDVFDRRPPTPRLEPPESREVPEVPPASLPEPLAPEPTAATLRTEAPIAAFERSAAVAFDEDRVAATLERVATHWTATEFVAKIVNQTEDTLWCSVVGKSARGRTLFAREPFLVAPACAASVPVMAPLRVAPTIARLVMYMSTPSLQCTTEAVVERPIALVFAAWFSIAVLVALSVAWWAFTVPRPRIDALVLVKRASAGQAISVAYATAGYATASYRVEPATGDAFGGSLPMGRHDFTFRTTPKPQQYRVVLSVAGALGSQTQEADVETVVPPVLQHVEPAAVEALEAVPAVAVSGQSIAVRYSAKATTGTITLRDPLGLTVASQPYTAAGVTQLVAPAVTAATMFELELHVARGVSAASASTGVIVMPAQPGQPSPPPGADVPASALVRIFPRRVQSAQEFSVQLLQHPSDLQLTLQDQHGAPIASQTIAADRSSTTFRAPLVFANAAITLVISYREGRAAHVALLPITVYAPAR